MTAFALAAILAYGFGPEDKLDYTLKATFEGFVPVLGGQQGKFEVTLGFGVQGNKRLENGDQSASSEAKSFELKVNGAALMSGVDAIKDYFPKTTISLDPSGKIVKSDAPDLKLPVRLPGLDAKRFPDITYVPIEFPKDGIEVGKEWKFEKSFDGSPIAYTCKVTKLEDATAEIAVSLVQKYEVLENESLEIVEKEDDAIAKVTTSLVGKGKASFDRKLGKFKLFDMQGNSSSEVKDLKSGKVSHRKLATRLLVEMKSEMTRIPGPPPTKTQENVAFFERILQHANRAWDREITKARLAYAIFKPKIDAWIRQGISIFR